MKLKLLNCRHPGNVPEGVDARKVWRSPDGRFVVAEAIGAEYFVAGKITEEDPVSGTLTVDCTDEFGADGDEFDFRGYTVDWDCMEYGFCKLRSRSMESFESKKYRIYFDPELYRRKYEELNGVPYDGRKKFRR